MENISFITGSHRSTPPTRSYPRSALWALFLAFLLLVLYLFGFFSSNSDNQRDVSNYNDNDGIEDSGQKVIKLEWKSRNKYDILDNVCFNGKDIGHANNRQGDHDACFAACLGFNLNAKNKEKEEDEMQKMITKEIGKVRCVGWTSKRMSEKTGSTHTCFLKSELDKNSAIPSAGCSSARLWEEALNEEETDYYSQGYIDDINDEEVEEYEYETGVDLEDASSEEEDYYMLYGDEDEYEKDEFDVNELSENPASFVVKTNSNKTFYNGTVKENVIVDSKKDSSKTISKIAVDDYSKPVALKSCQNATNSYGRPMRTFITCVQSSGCTLLSFLLAQNLDTVAILDVGVRQELPSKGYFMKAHTAFPRVKNIVLKQPLRGIRHDVKEYFDTVDSTFSPDYKILFLRDPVDTFIHLVTHIGVGTEEEPEEAKFTDCDVKDFTQFSYGLRCGTPVAKLKALNQAFVNQKKLNIKRVITYESLCTERNRKKLATKLNSDGFCLNDESVIAPQSSIIDVMKRAIKLLPSSKPEVDNSADALFWGAGHLANTFHHKELGHYLNQTEAFSLCGTMSTSARKKMLQTAGMPYSDWKIDQVIALVKKVAPELYAYYK